ncbi:MAG: glycine cleavage system protein GcvH [Planctomycetota bacterium]|nr:glycine cleavage system protein GcvH [Planctomycetota bacterium]MDA0920238.1 glycine cleavage system protein GcvH [Planctomycetota bacterium]
MDLASLKYAKSHEWVAVEGDIATIGITDFAVKALTDLVYVDLPAVGASVGVGDNCGEVESVKAVSDLYAPVSGEIVEVNEQLADNLDLLSDDAFGAGWILKIKMAAPADLDNLLDRAAYEQNCQNEDH